MSRSIQRPSDSTTIISVYAQDWRVSLASAYSDEFHHMCTARLSGNSSTTTRRGVQRPSRMSIGPPRTMYLPPNASIDAGAICL